MTTNSSTSGESSFCFSSADANPIANMRKAHLGLFYDHSYFDIMDWFAEQTAVVARLKKSAPYAAPFEKDFRSSSGNIHLSEKSKVTVPLATAALLVSNGLAELCVPSCYGEEVILNLRENPCVVNLRQLNVYFFEVGVKVAQITNDGRLLETLIDTAKDRMAQLMRICLESCDEEEKKRNAVMSRDNPSLRTASASHNRVMKRIELDEFLSGLTSTERHMKHILSEQLIPSDAVASLPSQRFSH